MDRRCEIPGFNAHIGREIPTQIGTSGEEYPLKIVGRTQGYIAVRDKHGRVNYLPRKELQTGQVGILKVVRQVTQSSDPERP